MARSALPPASTIDPTLVSLTRLLSHLQRNLLSPDAEFQLPRSSYERTKVGANLEYARSLLLRLEHDSAAIKIQSRKQNLHADLHAKRDLIKQLNQRLYELNQVEDTSEEDADSSGQEDEDLQPIYAPAVQGVSSSIDTEDGPSMSPEVKVPEINPSSALRSRRPQPEDSSKDRGTATGSLFDSRPKSPVDKSIAQRETRLMDDRTTQEALTDSLLNMAQALKDSSQRFSCSLEAEKDILERAASGLDKNTTGMDLAGQRMASLRRMTEGWGFFKRIGMYPAIGMLWMLAMFIVFFAPKLRF